MPRFASYDSVMPALAEPVETVETNAPFRPIAHIGRRENRRRGLCGAEILGIRAFGEFDLCPACRKLNGAILGTSRVNAGSGSPTTTSEDPEVQPRQASPPQMGPAACEGGSSPAEVGLPGLGLPTATAGGRSAKRAAVWVREGLVSDWQGAGRGFVGDDLAR